MIFVRDREYIEIIDIHGHGDFELTFLLVQLYTMTMIFYRDREPIEIIQFRDHRNSEL